MEKRLPLAIFLSVLLLFGWQMLNPPPVSPEGTDASGSAVPAGVRGVEGAGVAAVDASEPAPAVGPVARETEEREVTLTFGSPGEPGHYRATFHNRGGVLAQLRLGSYVTDAGYDDAARADPANWMPMLVSLDTGRGYTGSLVLRTHELSSALASAPLEDELWQMTVLSDEFERPTGVEFRLAPGTGIQYTKRILAVPGSYHLRFELELANTGADVGGASTLPFYLTPAAVVPEEIGDRFYPEPQVVVSGPYGEEDPKVRKQSLSPKGDAYGVLEVPAPLAFAGVMNKYFAAFLRGVDRESAHTMRAASYRNVYDLDHAAEEGYEPYSQFASMVADIKLDLEIPRSGESKRWSYDYFLGPKDRDLIVADAPVHEALLDDDLGMFPSIAKPLLWVLGRFHALVGNWGFAIILLTISVRALLFPLNRRSQTSMARFQKKMKRVQPLIDETKKKFEKDPQKQRQEQARIMQENGAFPPLGGCLPIFLQIPIFIGLFAALRTSFDLRQAPFIGWIHDLSQPDQLLPLDLNLGVVTVSHLNILPILMVVLWVLQQRLMPKPTDEQALRMQKMMLFMPVVMGVFLYTYASGLSLYMVTQSMLGIFEIKVIKKLWPIDDAEVEVTKKKRGCGPFSGFMEKIAEQHKEQLKRLQEAERQKSRQAGSKAKKRR